MNICGYLKYKLNEKIKRYKYLKLVPNDMRCDDIYLVSYPKSGNSWISFLITNVIIEYLELDINVNFFNMHFFIPDIHISRNIDPNLQFYPFRRIIKSHSAFNPYYKNLFLLIRHPIDVMISHYYFRKNLNQYSKDISSFIRDKDYGIFTWIEHTESWLNKCYPAQSIQLFHYENFLKNPGSELKRLFMYMGFDIDDCIISRAVNKSDIKTMKKIEKETQNYSVTKYDRFKFVRKGKSGRYNNELDNKDISFLIEKAGDTIEKVGYDFNSIY